MVERREGSESVLLPMIRIPACYLGLGGNRKTFEDSQGRQNMVYIVPTRRNDPVVAHSRQQRQSIYPPLARTEVVRYPQSHPKLSCYNRWCSLLSCIPSYSELIRSSTSLSPSQAFFQHPRPFPSREACRSHASFRHHRSPVGKMRSYVPHIIHCFLVSTSTNYIPRSALIGRLPGEIRQAGLRQ